MQYVQNTQNVSAQATGATAGIALNANPARIYCQIQNVGTNPIYLFLGTTAATASNYHQILKAGTASLDGTGGLYQSGGVVYDGAIAVGGTAPTFVAFELAP